MKKLDVTNVTKREIIVKSLKISFKYLSLIEKAVARHSPGVSIIVSKLAF